MKADEAESGAVQLIQRLESAASLNIHLHCLVLDGVYRLGTDVEPEFVDLPAPTDEAPQTFNVGFPAMNPMGRPTQLEAKEPLNGLISSSKSCRTSR